MGNRRGKDSVTRIVGRRMPIGECRVPNGKAKAKNQNDAPLCAAVICAPEKHRRINFRYLLSRRKA
jgi:hypothetical protein